MRIILDTDTRTIIVPWNYCAKLDEMNKLIMGVTDDPTKKMSFSSFADECWREAMEDPEKRIKIAEKPIKKKKIKEK